MNFKIIFRLGLASVILTGMSGCKEGNSIYDPDYKFDKSTPVVESISPANRYLAGVDSVIITGQNFATGADSVIVNFGGFPGIVKQATETQLIVRPGKEAGENLSVRVGVRGAEFFSESYTYTLTLPFGLYGGVSAGQSPTSPLAIDAQNNVYTIVNNGGVIRYVRIQPDGTITTDGVKYPGEPRPDPENPSPYPTDSTMRFTNYSSIVAGSNGDLLLAQQSLRAIFQKTFGDDVRETVWAASSNSNLQIRSMVIDNNGYLWVVGNGSNQIHRFDLATKSEAQFPFSGTFSAVAFFSSANELYVGGEISGSQQVWKFTIDGSGNIGNGELYFDYGQYYEGEVASMILASNGELLITDRSEHSIVRVFPDGKHEPLYEEMLKPGAFSITWRDDNIAVVAVRGAETSINFLDMYDRTRAGIFDF